MLNRFWSLSQKPFTPLLLTDSIKLDGTPTKIKVKIQACFTLYFEFWESSSVKSYKIRLPVPLVLVSHQFIYQQISSFYKLLELHWTLSEKDFCRKFFFFNGFTETPHHFNTQNLLSVTYAFLSIFPKMPSEFFLKLFADKILQNHLLSISSEVLLYI